MDKSIPDKHNGCGERGQRAVKCPPCRSEPRRECRWIPIRYEDVAAIVPVGVGALQPAALCGAHQTCPIVRISLEGQAA
jgi:hypothetical protein